MTTTPFAGLLRRAADLQSYAAYEVALAAVASRAGVSRDEISAALKAPAHERRYRHARAIEAHQRALYVARTCLQAPVRGLARVSGVAPKNVLKACAAVENRRDDAQVDRALDELELEVMA